jgi:hypothetical protein
LWRRRDCLIDDGRLGTPLFQSPNRRSSPKRNCSQRWRLLFAVLRGCWLQSNNGFLPSLDGTRWIGECTTLSCFPWTLSIFRKVNEKLFLKSGLFSSVSRIAVFSSGKKRL